MLFRGIKASPSFSFLEVVIGCELQNNEPVMEIKNDGRGTEEKKMVYLHLKKFFRGTRFTYLPFLKSIQSKYREGDHVYVSGKVGNTVIWVFWMVIYDFSLLIKGHCI